MAAAMAELDVERINPVGGALRLGVLYDLLGRTVRQDIRTATVAAVPDALAHRSRARGAGRGHGGRAASRRRCRIPIRRRSSISSGRRYCTKPVFRSPTPASTSTAPTFCKTPTCRASPRASSRRCRRWCFGCRGGLSKSAAALANPQFRAQLLALRLAVLFHHARAPIDLPRIRLGVAARIRFGISARWLKAHPLTAHLLDKEKREWSDLGYAWSRPGSLSD